KQNVFGLEIAVNDAVLMRVVERVRDVYRNSDRFVDRQLLFAIEPMPKALALDERHYVVQQPVRLSRIEQRQQVRMLKIRRDANLAQEALGAEHRAELGIEHFERDGSGMFDVACEIH